MKSQYARWFGSITFTVLLVFSVYVFASSTSSHASSSSDEVEAASGSNRFVVWQDNTPGKPDILLRRSTDNGATWKPTRNLSNNPGLSTFAQIAVSGSNVYVVWLQWNAESTLGDIFFKRSADNGATWSANINISTSGKIFTSQPRIAFSGTNVYIVWDEEQQPVPGDVFFRRSTDNGATWKSIVNISNNPEDTNQHPRIIASGNNVYVTWNHYPAYEALFRRSTDGGATWKTIVNLSDGFAASGTARIAVSGSNVYIAWSEGGILFRHSTDNGATWQPTKNLGVGLGPAMASSGSNVYLVWLVKRPVGAYYNLIFSGSPDNGATWGAKVTIKSGGLLDSYSGSVVASGNNAYVVWSQAYTGDIYFRHSTDNGATWQPTKNLSFDAGASSIPRMALSGSSVFVVWWDSTNEEVLLRRSIDSGSTWKTIVNLSSNSGDSVDAQLAV